jgi:hypothetical protein
VSHFSHSCCRLARMTHIGDGACTDEGTERERLCREPGMRVRRARRCKPRRPAGTFEMRDATGAVSCLPVSDGAKPSELQQLKIQLICSRLLEPVALGLDDGCLTATDTLQAFDSAFQAAFRGAPEIVVWLDPFIRELEHGRAKWFAAEYRGADPGPEERLEFARAVLDNTRIVVDHYRSRYAVLPRWLSVKLTTLFLQKVSFAGGGGPQGAFSPGRLRGLLADPGKMVRYLRANRTRERLFSVELAELERANAVAK